MVAYTTVDIATLIVTVRGKRVILDRDLAGLYGTTLGDGGVIHKKVGPIN